MDMQKGKIPELIGALIVGAIGSFVGLLVGSLLGANARLFAEVGGYEFTGLLGMLAGMSIGASLFTYFIRKQRKQTRYGKRIVLGAIGGLIYSLILFKLFINYNVAFILLGVVYISVVVTSWSIK